MKKAHYLNKMTICDTMDGKTFVCKKILRSNKNLLYNTICNCELSCNKINVGK